MQNWLWIIDGIHVNFLREVDNSSGVSSSEIDDPSRQILAWEIAQFAKNTKTCAAFGREKAKTEKSFMSCVKFKKEMNGQVYDVWHLRRDTMSRKSANVIISTKLLHHHVCQIFRLSRRGHWKDEKLQAEKRQEVQRKNAIKMRLCGRFTAMIG